VSAFSRFVSYVLVAPVPLITSPFTASSASSAGTVTTMRDVSRGWADAED
jgi:hypothetical protein